jgi:hypothetical protein
MSMAKASPGAQSCPSIEEHQADLGKVRARVAAMKERNAELEKMRRASQRKCDVQSDDRMKSKAALIDLEDRSKFITIASVSNPSPIGMYAPNLSNCPEPHSWYGRQVKMVKTTTRDLLQAEAGLPVQKGNGLSGCGPGGGFLREPKVKEIVSNFSQFQGHTLNSVRACTVPALLGLRSCTHSGANKKPGHPPRVLPKGKYDYQSDTNCWLARSDNFEVGRSRAHISSLTNIAM